MRDNSGRLAAATLLLCVFFQIPTAAEVREGWRVDFNDAELSGGIGPYYIVRKSGIEDRTRLESSVENGMLKLGGRFDKEGSADYVEVAWRQIGPFSTSEFPFLEIRCSLSEGASLLLMPTFEYADGSRTMPYFQPQVKEHDKLEVVAFRLAGDSSLPKKWTPRKVVGLVLWTMGSKPAAATIDWVRLRSFNAEEERREQEWVSLMRDYVPTDPPIDFFPFGIYGFHYSRLGDEFNYSDIARHHLNFAMDINPPPEKRDRILSIAERMGIRIGLRVRIAEHIYSLRGAEATRREMAPLMRLASRSKTVFGYDMADEPGLDRLHDLVAAKKIMEELDPTRPVWLNWWDLNAVKVFSPYVSYISTDLYPLASSNSRIPEESFTQCRTVARDSPDKRQIIILQAFGLQPWEKSGYFIPTVEQVRLQTYAALAGGAKGIVYYTYDCYVPDHYTYHAVVDAFGNARDFYEEIGRLGEELIPVCSRLLTTTVDFNSKVNPDNDKVIAGLLSDEKRRVKYLIAVNRDVKEQQRALMTMPAEWRSTPWRIYDLMKLKPASSDASRLDVGPLAPGAGRVYLIGTPKEYAVDAREIKERQVEEILRAQRPDLAVAAHYRADVRRINRLRKSAVALLARGKTHASMGAAREAGDELSLVLKRLSPYAGLRRQLERTGRIMGSVEVAMYPENLAVAGKVGKDLRDRYWALQKQWVGAMTRTITADTEGLAEETANIEQEAREIVQLAHGVLGSGSLY